VFLIPSLIARLSLQEGREAVRSALVSFDRDALDAIRSALHDPALERAVRNQLPTTLARFGSKQAADLLLEIIEGEGDGLVRYKAIRGLGRLVAEHKLGVDRVRIERLAYANLLEHLRLLGFRAVFEAAPPAFAGPSGRQPTKRLLVRLLDDKLRQSLERTFRLLKIAYPNEDFHRIHIACLSDDKRARANATEFLDAFFHRRDQHPLRALLRAVTDDLPIAERVLRTVSLTTKVTPATESEALVLLIDDADRAVAALARLHAASVAGEPMSVVIDSQAGTPVELSTNRARTAPAVEDRGPHA
jgi:HEAT repeat protein